MIRLSIALAFLLVLSACVPDRAPTTTGFAAGSLRGVCTGAPEFEAPPLNACTGPAIRLSFVGDVLLHRQLQDLGYRAGFASTWSQPARYLAAADIAVANLEGPVAPGLTRTGARVPDPGPVGGTDVYTGFPQFNYNPVILRDLKAAGIDIVTTANNHAMDRGPAGADMTLAEVARAGISPVGTVARGARRSFVLRRRTPLGTLSFIACSFSTNGLPDPDRQVLRCYRDSDRLLGLVRREATDPAVAGVIVLPHWGQEYQSTPAPRQRALARALVGAGATAVIGTHPHTVQPWEVETGPGGVRAPVVYSTGNFIAIQDFMPAKMEAMAVLDLCPGTGGRAVVSNAGWIAMQMRFSSRGYWAEIAPRGSGEAEAFLNRIAPGFSAQPPACNGG